MYVNVIFVSRLVFSRFYRFRREDHHCCSCCFYRGNDFWNYHFSNNLS